MTAAIETGATGSGMASMASMGEQGEQNMHRPRWARQEKSNLRVSDSVASPCCKLLISLNLARAWELAPIPQSCLARVSSNPTRRDLSLPTLFNNERYLGGSTTPTWSVLLPGHFGSDQVGVVSDSEPTIS